ncbi:hypothetical protein PR048_027948 [Dryococelus australis]|uniref:Carboxylesterase type B domain-containing protein n=1 Tax=Dryococelus australis TaxID=614101 RepID=A0ABQ9GHY1_9NEOP|nr:hypothetical protein PR048_027948 [Dryococelus australis]
MLQPPQPSEPWDGVLNATQDPNICVQRNIYLGSHEIEGQEDCLYLNVYTPQLPDETRETKLRPVMVWIHGGGWLSGGGILGFYSPAHLLDRDVVLVGFNYRLGALGFLSTGDKVCPGNNGMKDQVMALRWVRDNIAAFGGDPNSVTIFGQSAGGASVHYHVISRMSRGSRSVFSCLKKIYRILGCIGRTKKDNFKPSRQFLHVKPIVFQAATYYVSLPKAPGKQCVATPAEDDRVPEAICLAHEGSFPVLLAPGRHHRGACPSPHTHHHLLPATHSVWPGVQNGRASTTNYTPHRGGTATSVGIVPECRGVLAGVFAWVWRPYLCGLHLALVGRRSYDPQLLYLPDPTLQQLHDQPDKEGSTSSSQKPTAQNPGLFHHAISMSGSAFCPWAFAPGGSAKHLAEKIAVLLNCPTDSSENLVACLEKKDATEIIGTDWAFTCWGLRQTPSLQQPTRGCSHCRQQFSAEISKGRLSQFRKACVASRPRVRDVTGSPAPAACPLPARRATDAPSLKLPFLETPAAPVFDCILFPPHICAHQDYHPILSGLVYGSEVRYGISNARFWNRERAAWNLRYRFGRHSISDLKPVDCAINACQQSAPEWDWHPRVPFRPVIETEVADGDEKFLTKDPRVAVAEQDLAPVPWMAGLTSGEGALVAVGIFQDEKLLGELNDDFDRIAPMSLFYRNTSNKADEITRKVREYYFGEHPIDRNAVYEVVDVSGVWVTSPLDWSGLRLVLELVVVDDGQEVLGVGAFCKWGETSQLSGSMARNLLLLSPGAVPHLKWYRAGLTTENLKRSTTYADSPRLVLPGNSLANVTSSALDDPPLLLADQKRWSHVGCQDYHWVCNPNQGQAIAPKQIPPPAPAPRCSEKTAGTTGEVHCALPYIAGQRMLWRPQGRVCDVPQSKRAWHLARVYCKLLHITLLPVRSMTVNFFFAQMYTDAFMTADMAEAVKAHVAADVAPAFYYVFDHRGTHTYAAFIGDATLYDYGEILTMFLIMWFLISKNSTQHNYLNPLHLFLPINLKRHSSAPLHRSQSRPHFNHRHLLPASRREGVHQRGAFLREDHPQKPHFVNLSPALRPLGWPHLSGWTKWIMVGTSSRSRDSFVVTSLSFGVEVWVVPTFSGVDMDGVTI